MNETTKTLGFLVAAALALGAAWIGRPKPIGVDLPDLVGQELFADFTDPYDAKSMEIVQYDEDLGELRKFEIAQKNGLWVIPSHQDYPADAQETFSEAANLLVGLKVINVQTQEAKEHATYGVIRPNVETLQAGDAGVGKLVTFRDETGSRLAEIVIGKEVTGQPNQRFVRAGEQQPVYIVELDPSKLSTEFKDWVERDVLDLNGFDLTDMSIRDYSIELRQTRQRQLAAVIKDRLRLDAKWNADEASWELGQFEEFVGGEMKPSQLLDSEELDKEALDTMKQALDDLVIVDVERKPQGLGAELIDDSFWNNRDGIDSLGEHGFYAAQDADGNSLFRCSDGEVLLRTKDGIEYHLRFGEVAGIGGGATTESEEDSETGLNRFVMVSARVYEDAFEKPILDVDGNGVADESSTETETSSDASESSDSEETSESSEVGESEEEQLAREAVVKEYERQLEEYNDKISSAQEKVNELNFRFADWYYVVAENEYRKIRLSRSDIIRGKESTAKEGNDIEAFRALQDAGITSNREAATP